MVDFIKAIIGALDIAPDKTRIAAVGFANKAQTYIMFGAHVSRNELLAAAEQLKTDVIPVSTNL